MDNSATLTLQWMLYILIRGLSYEYPFSKLDKRESDRTVNICVSMKSCKAQSTNETFENFYINIFLLNRTNNVVHNQERSKSFHCIP